MICTPLLRGNRQDPEVPPPLLARFLGIGRWERRLLKKDECGGEDERHCHYSKSNEYSLHVFSHY